MRHIRQRALAVGQLCEPHAGAREVTCGLPFLLGGPRSRSLDKPSADMADNKFSDWWDRMLEWHAGQPMIRQLLLLVGGFVVIVILAELVARLFA